MSFLGGKKQREQWEFHPFWLDGCGWWGLPMLPQRIWIHCCHLLLDNVSCKSHFAQAKDTVLSGFFRTSQTSWKQVMVGDLLWRRRTWMMTATIICCSFSHFLMSFVPSIPPKDQDGQPKFPKLKGNPSSKLSFFRLGVYIFEGCTLHIWILASSGKVAVVASKEPAELVAFVSLREGEELELAARWTFSIPVGLMNREKTVSLLWFYYMHCLSNFLLHPSLLQSLCLCSK